MNWIQNISRAITFIEANIMKEITIDEIAQVAYASSPYFQRLFNLTIGMTVGDYIRNRRLSLAGQEILKSNENLIDVAFRYHYETSESFSKAFSRFHGFPPSHTKRNQKNLKIFSPVTIQVSIRGGFNMSRKIIENVPIHQLQYPDQGQNYVFNGCMKFLMECVGEKADYDYWFFSFVSGDCFVQVFGADKSKWYTCFSQSKFDRPLINRVFHSIGYNYTFVAADEWRRDKDMYRRKIVNSIDKGIPVIGKGFYWYSNLQDEELPTDEVSCIIGYENDGEGFYRLPEEATNLIPFSLNDTHPYTFVFLEEKKETPNLSDVYRSALLRVPGLMQTPSDSKNGIFFGNEAFEKWASMLESDYYCMTRDDYHAYNKIAEWRYYAVYVCNIATNIFSRKHFLDRMLQYCPETENLVKAISEKYEILDGIEKSLGEVGGGFDINFDTLQNVDKRGRIAGVLREFPRAFNEIVEIIEKVESCQFS